MELHGNTTAVIRDARPEDAAEYLRFLKIVGGETDNLSFGAEGIPATPEQYAGVIERFTARADCRMLMAWDKNEIVGYASLTGDRTPRFSHRAELAIFIRRDHWGMGIGSALMEALIAYAKERSLAVLSLQVRSDNLRAIRLYEKYGFRSFGRYEKFFRMPEGDFAAEYMNLDL